MRREDAEAALVRLADEADLHRRTAAALREAAARHRERAEHADAQAAEREGAAEGAERAAEAIRSAWEAEGDPIAPAEGDALVIVTIDGADHGVRPGPTPVQALLQLAGKNDGQHALSLKTSHERLREGIVRVRPSDAYLTHWMPTTSTRRTT